MLTDALQATATGEPAAAVRRAPARRRRWHGWTTAIVLALPGLAVFGLFSWWPMIRSGIMAFQETNLIGGGSWVGLRNFAYVLHDPALPQAVRNTLWFALLGLVLGFPIPIALAVFISEQRGWRSTFSVLAYLPAVIPPVVAILLWRVFYDPSPEGALNALLRQVGLGPYSWLNSTSLAMPAVVMEVIWATAGSTTVVYLGALSRVGGELYEAAEIDGCGIWKRIWHVTLPQMRGFILVLLLLQLIGTLQVFTEPFLLTGGGPANSTTTVLMLIYNYAFVYGNFGAAAALSAMLMAVLTLVAALYLAATRRWSRS
ncbi:carbohydrate ABC transporter permease [Nonomuraea pusilla]|uniref:Multiple sugar transport system permease protein n=1 Tax=Nonomuraea pusilla TaxID=46177 RepID=A0A1H8AC69_9ACTN|nr:sugar ABC transporter permease [Nonomuraea pusilla]SEM68066.1 multiple sugar transport system permease protein [Nonomuraea pusilla]